MTFLALGSNTVHLLLPELQSRTQVPFVSMIESVSDQISDDHISRVGVVSSSMTRAKKLYSQTLVKKGVQVVLPTLNQQAVVDQVIRSVLAGELSQNLQKKYHHILVQLFKSGAQSILLGCTELPLALDYEQLAIPSYNCVRILARHLTDRYYQNLNQEKDI